MESESVKTQVLLEDAGWIRRLAGSLIADEADAEDAAQDTWVAALRRPPRGGRSARPWLAHVLRNFARHRARSEGNRAAREELAARAEAQPSAEELILRAERQRELVALVVALEEPYRTTLLLRFFEGLSPAGIAELQGVRGATVRSRIQRGLSLLRTKLDAQHGDRNEWVRGLAPLPVSLGPLGNGNGWESPTPGSGAETMLMATKLALIAGSVLVGGAATVGVLTLRGNTGPQEAPEKLGRARSETAGHTAAVSAGEDLAGGELVGVDTTEGRLELDLPPSATLRGSLLDETDGAPLADFEFLLRSHDGTSERLRTDADGGFVSARSYAEGALVLDLVDHRANRVHIERDVDVTPEGEDVANHEVSFESNLIVEHDLDHPRLDLDVAAGPTFPLELVMDEEIDLAGATAVLRPFLSMKAGTDHALTVLRSDEEGPWVRFGALANAIETMRGYAVEVRDGTGLWAGIGIARSTSGMQPPVRVELFGHAVLEGRVVTTDGEPVPGQDLVLNVGTEKAHKERMHRGAPLQYRTHTDGNGNYRFRWVQPDSYELALVIDGAPDFAERLPLEAGRQAHDLIVDPLESRASLRGLVTSVSRSGSPNIQVFIDRIDANRPEEGQGHEPERRSGRKSTRVEWEETSAGVVGRFAFPALPAGEYVLRAHSRGFAEVTPLEQVVTVPSEVELVIQDTTAQDDLTYRAVDASDGKRIKGFHTRFVLDSKSETPVYREFESDRDGVAVVEGVPLEPEISWRVQAPGYQPVWGDRASFGGADEIELSLLRGWGTAFVVYGRDHEALAGALVFLDDELVGETDTLGQLRHTQTTQPARVRVEWTDGTVSYREELLEVKEYQPVVTVVFESEEPAEKARK